ncbi:ORF032L [Rock bream iridovirus]|uniref:ORF032L n=1 Tax=Rock bream iridovirus TaxID=263891 RepID=Q5YF55_ISKNV|nr:ORF032L [Rock bream iridovirus]
MISTTLKKPQTATMKPTVLFVLLAAATLLRMSMAHETAFERMLKNRGMDWQSKAKKIFQEVQTDPGKNFKPAQTFLCKPSSTWFRTYMTTQMGHKAKGMVVAMCTQYRDSLKQTRQANAERLDRKCRYVDVKGADYNGFTILMDLRHRFSIHNDNAVAVTYNVKGAYKDPSKRRQIRVDASGMRYTDQRVTIPPHGSTWYKDDWGRLANRPDGFCSMSPMMTLPYASWHRPRFHVPQYTLNKKVFPCKATLMYDDEHYTRFLETHFEDRKKMCLYEPHQTLPSSIKNKVSSVWTCKENMAVYISYCPQPHLWQ